eukprot:4047756-Prymnesium_polylepis.1
MVQRLSENACAAEEAKALKRLILQQQVQRDRVRGRTAPSNVATRPTPRRGGRPRTALDESCVRDGAAGRAVGNRKGAVQPCSFG